MECALVKGSARGDVSSLRRELSSVVGDCESSHPLSADDVDAIAESAPCVEWELADVIGFESAVDWSDVVLPVVWRHLRSLRSRVGESCDI